MRTIARSFRHATGYWTVRALFAVASALPLGALRTGGSGLGRAALALARRDAGRAREHLALAFPERSERWRAEVLGACARHLGRLLGEVAWLWSVSADELLARTELVGLDHLTGPLQPRRGAVLVTGHCGNWEWMNLALGAAGVAMTVAARDVYDPRIGQLAVTLRGRFGGGTELRGEGAGRRLAGALRSGRVVGLLIDQDIDAPGFFVEFFGRPAWTPSGAAVLALRLKAPVVTGFATRLDDGRMRVAFDPPMLPAAGPDIEAASALLTARLTARIEAQLREHPAQWVWMHRRWRRTPAEGEPVWTAEGARQHAHV